MNSVYIVAAQRTPFGSFLGALSKIPAPVLGGIALKAAFQKSGLTDAALVEQLYWGNVVCSNLGQAPASQVLYYANFPETVAATMVNKVCASGTKAIMLAAQSIQIGLHEITAAGGSENMSLIPHYIEHYRTGHKYGSTTLIDGLVRDGLQDPYSFKMMGQAAELVAKEYQVTRKEQDEYAIRSYQLANVPQEDVTYHQLITPVEVAGKTGTVTVQQDEEFGNFNPEKLFKLKPVFVPEEGTITAANASKISDGAVAVILASEKAVQKYNLKPLLRIVGYADAQRHYDWWTLAVADSISLALKKANLTIEQIDAFEI
ncbi:MAG: acetyl-CoA C-acyltransferase, partial [Bacteroidia bacterium]|nr:acetyl-CoA C-acyltransferase [Bacteroidia bacterium]MDW8159021.1 acetyl-CoA C-acyltransferase [Bacteroidia bacterium]